MVPFQNYQTSIDIIKEEDLIPPEYRTEVIVDDYRELPIEDDFQTQFNFFQGNIYEHYNYGIKPGIFFYNTNTYLNAFAARWKNHFIISFNKGTVIFLQEKFKNNKDLFDEAGLEKYRAAELRSDKSLNELMYQLCSNYIFYHELGHLIQKPDRLAEMLNEDIVTKKAFEIQDHILEYDADLFSSIYLGSHLYQYIENWCPDASNKDPALIIGAVMASIFLLLLSFPSANNDLYFDQKSHPHPFVRIVGILSIIVDRIKLLSETKKEITLDPAEIIENTLEVTEIIANKVLVELSIANVKQTFIENLNNISAYNKKLQSLVIAYEDSAYNKRYRKLRE